MRRLALFCAVILCLFITTAFATGEGFQLLGANASPDILQTVGGFLSLGASTGRKLHEAIAVDDEEVTTTLQQLK